MYGIYRIQYKYPPYPIHGCVIFAPCLFDVFGKEIWGTQRPWGGLQLFLVTDELGLEKGRQKRAPLGGWFPQLSTYTVGITHLKAMEFGHERKRKYLQFGDDLNHHMVINHIFPMGWSSDPGCTTKMRCITLDIHGRLLGFGFCCFTISIHWKTSRFGVPGGYVKNV